MRRLLSRAIATAQQRRQYLQAQPQLHRPCRWCQTSEGNRRWGLCRECSNNPRAIEAFTTAYQDRQVRACGCFVTNSMVPGCCSAGEIALSKHWSAPAMPWLRRFPAGTTFVSQPLFHPGTGWRQLENDNPKVLLWLKES